MIGNLSDLSKAEWQQISLRAKAERQRRINAGTWEGGTRAHVEYQDKPVEWIEKYLGIPSNTIRWSENPEYRNCTCNTNICQGGGEHVWDGEKDPLEQALKLLSQGKSASLPAATGTGKSFVAGACGALWFLACFPDATVLTIAPKQELLLKNMWKEIGKLWPLFKSHFPNAMLLTDSLRMYGDEEGKREVWTASAFGAGVGADEELAAKAKGFHGRYMLWIVEEMQGMAQPIINTIMKTAVGEFNPILGLGNPSHQYDPLAAFGRRSRVTPLRISGYDYPNVVCDREVVPGARSRQSIEDDLADADGDENDPTYISQVRGVAPEQSTRALIRRKWCDAAAARWGDQELRAGPLALGVDPSDSPSGDKSAISHWQGACCTEVDTFRAEDASKVGQKVYEIIKNPWNPVDPRYVGIDAIGVGASTVNELKRLGVKIKTISGAMKAVPRIDREAWRDADEEEATPNTRQVPEAERYANLRAQVYWRLREDLRLGRIALPDDSMLFEELCAIEYDDSSGKILITDKKKLRSTLSRSPDRADAVAYGNWARPRHKVENRPDLLAELEAESNRDAGLERMLLRKNREQQREANRVKRALAARSRAKNRSDRRYG